MNQIKSTLKLNAMPVSNIKQYAPYVYFHRASDGTYDLYVMVPCGDNKTIDFNTVEGVPNLAYLNGSTKIFGKVVPHTGAVACNRASHFKLNPAGLAGFTTAFELIVTIINEDNTKRVTTLVYEDATFITPNPSWIFDNIAHNCPYLYLSNPEAINGNTSNLTEPSCLLYLSDHQLSSQQVILSSADAGLCEQQIILVKSEGSNTDVSPLLDVNGVQYYENSPMTGSFAVTILFDETTVEAALVEKKALVYSLESLNDWNRITYFDRNTRESASTGTQNGKIRNISSDANPNGFID